MKNELTERRRRAKWSEFFDFIERHIGAHWLFRGVADAEDHQLVPKIGRDEDRYTLAKRASSFLKFQAAF